MAQVLRINDIDNVVIAAEEIKLGTIIIDQGRQIKVLDDIPIGHKIATSKIKKGGNSIVTDVLNYGDRVKTKGFNLISGPGNDLVGITNQEAAGCVMTVFTTGRGTPTGFATPLIRLGSNSSMSKRKNDWIDYNAGDILDGVKDFGLATEELLELILQVASGDMQSKAEAKGYRQIGMLRDGITN